MKIVLMGLAAAAVVALPMDGMADEATQPESFMPYIDGSLSLELENDHFYRSDDPDNEFNEFYFTGELAIAIHFLQQLALNFGTTTEPVLDPLPGTDRYLGDHGLYLDTLNLEASFGNASLTGGKFAPGFGTAWDVTPGIYGTALAEDYELAEMLGFGVAYGLPGLAMGDVTLGANIFMVDTTLLSESLFTERGRTSLSDGGAANTGSLDNFSFTIDGEDIAALPGFGWHFGYRYLSAGQGDVSAENGFVAGVNQTIALPNEVELVLNGEVAYLVNALATASDAVYVTGGLQVIKGPWHGELAGTLRQTDFSTGGRQNDGFVQVSAGHLWDNGIDISIGYAYTHDGGVNTQTVGALLTKTFDFSTR
ncbi:MAG: hypothetical protein NXI27_06740 [Alphaproteobacteria bacterium]|nr:hypothetical protein [Alphaproteobacteria bacterium]